MTETTPATSDRDQQLAVYDRRLADTGRLLDLQYELHAERLRRSIEQLKSNPNANPFGQEPAIAPWKLAVLITGSSAIGTGSVLLLAKALSVI
ncbi:hypothetical protein ACHFJ0_09705 [Paracoccus sp. NGMCC 1.201697]|uniref:DUF3618 domain-containing protein n=1 Tax=Paracoccus broussonetiae subsp. drimophilus TaxID=3373869 RepID=A0ABW7LJL2_9RHOB